MPSFEETKVVGDKDKAIFKVQEGIQEEFVSQEKGYRHDQEDLRNEILKDIKALKEEVLNETKKAKEYLIEEGKEEKERIIAEGLKELEKRKEDILEEAKNVSEEIRSQAYEDGKNQGLVEVRSKIDKKTNESLKSLKSILSELSQLKPKIVKDCERDIVDLATFIASKIIRQELKSDPRIILNMVSREVKEFEGKAGGIRVKLNPEDYNYILSLESGILDAVGLSDVVFEQDKSILKGGCVIESYTARIDARIERQLEIIHQKLMGKVEYE